MMHALRHMRAGRRPAFVLGFVLLLLMMLCVPTYSFGGGGDDGRGEAGPAGVGQADAAGRFRGFACMGSCAAHQAGYAWAEANAGQFHDCHGHNWAFTEGCVAYLHDNPSAI